jgi:hypothetical protein
MDEKSFQKMNLPFHFGSEWMKNGNTIEELPPPKCDCSISQMLQNNKKCTHSLLSLSVFVSLSSL